VSAPLDARRARLPRTAEVRASEHAAIALDARRAYLRGLEWDGARRVEHFAATILRRPTRAAAARCKAFLLHAVGRTFAPGAAPGPVFVLSGPQGTGKSSVLSALAGAEFAQITELRAPPVPSWIVEVCEPEALGASELKAFLTATADTFRAPYARHATTTPRAFAVACTTNSAAWSRNDRMATVRVTERVNLALLTTWRDQLWAEAVHLYRQQGGAA